MQYLGPASERPDPMLIASSIPDLELMDDVSSHSSEAPRSWVTVRRLDAGLSRAGEGKGGRERGGGRENRVSCYSFII